MSQDSTQPRVRSAWSELELLGGVILAVAAVLQVVFGNFVWAAFKLLLAISAITSSRSRDLEDGVMPLIRWTPPRAMRMAYYLAFCYLLCWLASYWFVVGRDFRFVDQYFKLGWTGGLEIPTSIQIIALGLTAAISGIGWGLITWRRRASKRNSTG